MNSFNINFFLFDICINRNSEVYMYKVVNEFADNGLFF